ncbi:MAG: TonB-dependent receptor [Porphyromonas sp.]|nr:TonB-dependent receptor [Porphyromonas sp.]
MKKRISKQLATRVTRGGVLLLMALLSLSTSLFAQNTITVKGTILDELNEPVISATVVVLGEPNKGAISDFDGHFTITDVPSDAILRISYVGYQTQEVPLNGQRELTIQLMPDSEVLSEVVVVGYTTQRKESLTGSLQQISADDLKTTTTPSVENMLSSKSPGVYVAPGSGQPGSSGAVVIRGKSTINGSTAPLWVIDGVIVGSGPGTLNPNDVETMTILKDAASTAIYGSQGANGVIVVTTKSAKSGDLMIDVSMLGGLTTLNNGNFHVMNGAELYDLYASFGNEQDIKFARWTPELRNSNYDWWDLATRTGTIQNYNVTIRGGSDKVSTMTSVGVYEESGAVRGYKYTRYNGLARTTYRPTDWLTIKSYISGAMRDNDDRQHSVTAMYSNLPWDNPYDKDGKPMPHRSQEWVNSNSTNYLYDLQWNKGDSRLYDFSINLDFDVKLTDWLTFSSVNNYKFNNLSSHWYTDPRSDVGQGVDGRISEYRSSMQRRYTNQIFRITKSFDRHYINGLVAYEFNDYRSKDVDVSATGIPSGFETLNVTTKPEKTKGGVLEWAVQSFFTQFNYSYDDRYIAEFSLRRDGASNFGSNAQYGNFFSISGGWNVHKEAFFNADVITLLKLRASYGSVGNRPSALYPQYSLYSATATYDGVPGLLISQIGSADLTWEKSYNTGVGLDVDFWDRLHFNFDFYKKDTSDLLYAVPISGLNGVTSVWKNVGAVSNLGVEASVGAEIIRTNDWLWTVNANIGFNRNRVDELYGTPDPVTGKVPPIVIGGGAGIAGEANRILEVGENADTWYLPEWAGVDPKDGSPMWYKTVENNGVKSRETTHSYAEADLVKIGSYNPDFFGGFSTALQWKNLDMNAVFGFSYGGLIYNYSRMEYDSDGTYTDRNQMRLMPGWSRWEKEGDIATHPLPMYNGNKNSNKTSSRYLEDGSYLKLRSLSLGYNIALEKYKISNIRIALTGENLFTLTKYSGVDPELPSHNGAVIGSVSPSVYPSTRKFTLGVTLSL